MIDGLITNFHLPRSSLLMLVAAFAGRERVLAAYAGAVARALPVLQLRRCDADPVIVSTSNSQLPVPKASLFEAIVWSGSWESGVDYERRIVRAMKFAYEEFDLSGVRTYPLASRASKANAADFAQAVRAGQRDARRGWRRCRRSSPAPISRRWSPRCARAHDGGRGIIWGLGAHVIKTGLGPVLIDLMERGFVSAIATNGAGVIHDFELALSGATSEEVDEALGPGRFGMAEETGRLLNAAINDGVARGLGDRPGGRAMARATRARRTQPLSIVAAAARLEIPVTVHVGIGTDIIHMHPAASGAALGEGSLRDFRYFVSNVARLGARRLPELRLGGHPARGLPEGRRARAQPRASASTA